jgi:hypothetical protein
VETPLEVAAQVSRNGSFEDRMQEVRKQREQRTTEMFEVPGFEHLFEVEMQVLGVKKMNDIAFKHTRVRDDSMRALYVEADQVMAATVAFHKFRGDGSGETDLAEGMTWMDAARAYDPNLSVTVSPRAAIIRLLDDGKGLGELHGSWYTWNTRGNESVEKELGQDFMETLS